VPYINPDIESSYRENNLGKYLYQVVFETRPKKIIEFGGLGGYSSVAMAMALRDLGQGHIYSYDLWEKYPHKHCTMASFKKNIKRYGVQDFVTAKEVDLFKWVHNPEDFDLLHLDVSNTGDILVEVLEAAATQIDNGSIVLFEGGSSERDCVDWMLRYKKQPIFPLKDKLKYDILSEKFPSLSIVKK